MSPKQSFKTFIGIQKYPAPNKLKFTMPAIQQKITRYAKKQENVTQNQEEEKQIEANPEIEQMIELVYKNI